VYTRYRIRTYIQALSDILKKSLMYYIHRRITCVNRKLLSPRRNGTDYNVYKKKKKKNGRRGVWIYFIAMGFMFVVSHSRSVEPNIIHFNKPYYNTVRRRYYYLKIRVYYNIIWPNNIKLSRCDIRRHAPTHCSYTCTSLRSVYRYFDCFRFD
jgi:hypothetical protein